MLRTILPAIALSAAISAQFTSPAGYLTTEGSSNHDYILFRYNDLRWQQLDATSVNTQPTVVTRISWRRDGTSANDPTWTARTIDIGVYLAHSVMPGAISETYDANYLTPPLNAFVSRPVNLPDWTQQPATPPAPWNLAIQLDQPWVYNGNDPFLWELRITNNNTASDYGNDFQSIPGSTQAVNSGTTIGTGCVATGQTTAMALAGSFQNQFVRMRAAYTVSRAPAMAPTYLFLDRVNSNLQLPGLCTTLVAMPVLAVAMGLADANGGATLAVDNIPHAGSVGVTLYAQAAAIDPGQTGLPLALSNGRSNAFPATPATPATVTRVYGYRLTPTSMRAPSVWTGGIVTRFN
jgi:hypothetical protein